MAIICDRCGKVITTIYFIRKDHFSFCSYRCYKSARDLARSDYIINRKRIGHDLLGIKTNRKRRGSFLPEGDISGSSMVRATNYERMGEYQKAINCWKRILILHDEDNAIAHRANRRIRDLQDKLQRNSFIK